MATPSTSTTSSASSPSPSSSTDKKALATASTADFRASATGLKRDGETGEAVHTIVSGRKCWRIMKGKDEAVWPPALEAALIEGLEKYKPSESRSTRSLGRFPMRNKFISDYIFETTGKRRTPKQVGSRIQQLRDTSSGKQILKTYSDRHYEMMRPSRAAASQPSTPSLSAAVARREMSPTVSVHSDAGYTSASPSPAPSTSHVQIEVLPPSASSSVASSSTSAFYKDLSRSDFRVLGPRLLRNIDPTVTFTSAQPVACYSRFEVRREGRVVSREETRVEETSVEGDGGMFVYRTMLAPGVWRQLCESEEPELYSIHQEIILASPDASSASTVLSAVTYHFINTLLASTSSRQLSPNPSIRSDSLSSAIRTPDLDLDLQSDFDDLMMLADPTDHVFLSQHTQHSPYLHPHLHTSASPSPAFNLAPQHQSHAMDDLLPDLLHYGDDGYASFPSSPSEVSTISSWPTFHDAANTNTNTPSPNLLPQLSGLPQMPVGCGNDAYGSTGFVGVYGAASAFDESAISEMVNFF